MKKVNNPEWFDTGRKDSLGRPIREKHKKLHRQHSGTTAGKVEHLHNDFQGDDHPVSVEVDIPISDTAEEVVDALSRRGYTPYLVGGSVRDFLLGVKNKDVDIEVYGVEDTTSLAKTLRETGGDVNVAGMSFGVLKYTKDGEELDISLPRKDSLKDTMNTHRSIEVQVDTDLTEREASTRRDFTINALMYDPVEGTIVDYHGGLEDMKNKTLRVVDDSTFTDDPLRVLRGVQFAARFDYKMDDNSIKLSRTMGWEGLAPERVAGELHKMLLKSKNLHRGVSTLRDTGWDKAVPGITRNFDNPLPQDAVNIVSALKDKSVAMGCITAMMDTHYGDSQGKLSKSFMLTNKERKVFNKMKLQDASDVIEASRMRRFLHNKGVDQSVLNVMSQAVGVSPAASVWGEGNPPEYTVNGDYLINKGLTPSRSFSVIIQKCQDIEDAGGTLTEHDVDRIIAQEAVTV